MRRCCLLLFVLFLFGTAVCKGHGFEGDSLRLKVTFRPGERVTYGAWYNWGFIWLSAGWIDFSVAEGSHGGVPVYQLTGAGSTYKSYDPFFPVRDTLRCELDKETLSPFWAYKHAHEGKWHGNDEFSFERTRIGSGDSARLGWKVETRLRRKGKFLPTVTELTANDGFDILSSVYRLRCIPEAELLKADPMTIPMRLDDGEYDIYLYYRGDETIKLHKGEEWDCHLFHVTLVEGSIFKKGDYMKIWLSKDGNCLPVQMEAPITVGSVKAIFKDASGLLH